MYVEMNHIDQDFPPIRKSDISVEYNKIVQDVKRDHSQIKKLENITLISRSVGSIRKPKLIKMPLRKTEKRTNENKVVIKKEEENLIKIPLLTKNLSVLSNKNKLLCRDSQSKKFIEILNEHISYTLSNDISLKLPDYFVETSRKITKTFQLCFQNNESPKPCILRAFYKDVYNLFERALVKECEKVNKNFVKIFLPSSSTMSGSTMSGQDQLFLEEQTRYPGISKKMTIDYRTDDLKKRFFRKVGTDLNLGHILEALYETLHDINRIAELKKDKIEHKKSFFVLFSIEDINLMETPLLKPYWNCIIESMKKAQIPVFVVAFQHSVGKPAPVPNFVKSAEIINIPALKSLAEFRSELSGLLKLDLNLPSENTYRAQWNDVIIQFLNDPNSNIHKIMKEVYLSGEGPRFCLSIVAQIIQKCHDFSSVCKKLKETIIDDTKM